MHVQLAESASLELVERHVSASALGSFVNAAVQVQLGRAARCRHYRLQELSALTISFDTLSATLAQEAAYRLHAISLGAQSSRSTPACAWPRARRGGAAAVQLGQRRRCRSAHRTRSPHAHRAAVPRTPALAVAFNGGRRVRGRTARACAAAGRTEAGIDVRPQLEIYTDEVPRHGATTGKLDEQMLFPAARGSTATAQRLLKWAFLEDAVANNEIPELRRQIELSLAGALGDEALKELL